MRIIFLFVCALSAGVAMGSHEFMGKTKSGKINDVMSCHGWVEKEVKDEKTGKAKEVILKFEVSGTQSTIGAMIKIGKKEPVAIGSFGVDGRPDILRGRGPNGETEEIINFYSKSTTTQKIEMHVLRNMTDKTPGPWNGRVKITTDKFGIIETEHAACDAHPEPQD